MLIFVTGGARSGKSRFAEGLAGGLAAQAGPGVTYVATAVPFDTEMQDRIGRHRADRPAHWLTVEEPVKVPQVVLSAQTPVILLDCLSLWVNNLLYHDWTDDQILQAADLLAASAQGHAGTVILVTNEVGLGIVPDNALSRRYRDLLGWVNQRCAAASDEAYLLVSGLPVRLK